MSDAEGRTEDSPSDKPTACAVSMSTTINYRAPGGENDPSGAGTAKTYRKQKGQCQ